MKWLLALLFTLSAWAQSPEFGPLDRPVIDQLNLLSQSQARDLEANIRELAQGGGPQVGIYIAASLQDYAVEDFTIRLAEKWQLGGAKSDNGLLIVVAPRERKMRIEVGGGIEGSITDLEASRLIRDVLAPAFRAQDYAGGLKTVLFAVAKKFDVKLSGKPLVRRVRRSTSELSPMGTLVFVIIFFIVLPLLNRSAGGRGFRSSGYGGFGGSGGWGGRSGGSSWGGGGGGFSGGGASGDW